MTRALILLLCSLSLLHGQIIIDSYRYGAAAPGVDLLSGLVAYWNLNEVSGNRAASVGFTLTDNNTVTSSTGVISNAANFESGSDEYLSATDATAAVVDFSGNQSFTIAFWLNLESVATNQYFIGKYDGAGNQRQYLVYLNATTDKIYFVVSNDGTAFPELIDSGTRTTGTWYFIVAWHDADADTMNLQINNGTIESMAHTTGVFSGTASFMIGARHDNTTTATADGAIDEPGIWNRVLNADERTALWNSGNGITYPF